MINPQARHPRESGGPGKRPALPLWIPAFAGMTLEYRIGLLAREGTMAETSRMDRNLALEAVRVTEAAALSASRLMGRGDEIGRASCRERV